MTITLGFIAIARPTFDTELASQETDTAYRVLESAGYTLIGTRDLIMSLDEAAHAIETLKQTPLDLLVIFQASFADSTMALQVAEHVPAPLLLWAVPEARTGGRLRLNSLCGINLAGHALTRAGYPYEYLFAAPDNPVVPEKIGVVARAATAYRRLQGAKIGRVGENPAGFETCLVNHEALKNQLGVEVQQIALQTVFEGVAEKRQSEAAIGAVAAELRQTLTNYDALDPTATNGTLGAYITLKEIAARDNLQGFAVRCWPEFFTEMGCAACGAVSLLNQDRLPGGCEADVNGTLTQLILQWISDAPAFGSDIVDFNFEEDTAVLWHCGQAPLSMCDPDYAPQGTIHSNRKLPLLMQFPLKPGRVTLARLSEATGSLRLVIGAGEMVAAPPSFSGTSGVIHFDRSAEAVLDTLLREGLEHHLALVYGDYVAELEALARLLRLPTLML